MKQGFILDTDIFSYYLKNEPRVVRNLSQALENESDIGITILTHYEILSGLKFKFSNKLLKPYKAFQKDLWIYPLTEKSIEISSDIYSSLRKKGNPLDDMDILIAGVAIENKKIFVTNNLQHFERIKHLELMNWKL